MLRCLRKYPKRDHGYGAAGLYDAALHDFVPLEARPKETDMALYAFDGTWNSATLDDNIEQDNETNVANFSAAYTGPKWYVSGPGTRFGDVGRVIGGAFGAGGPERVKEAYKQLCQNWA